MTKALCPDDLDKGQITPRNKGGDNDGLARAGKVQQPLGHQAGNRAPGVEVGFNERIKMRFGAEVFVRQFSKAADDCAALHNLQVTTSTGRNRLVRLAENNLLYGLAEQVERHILRITLWRDHLPNKILYQSHQCVQIRVHVVLPRPDAVCYRRYPRPALKVQRVQFDGYITVRVGLVGVEGSLRSRQGRLNDIVTDVNTVIARHTGPSLRRRVARLGRRYLTAQFFEHL